jgi:exodeoxyribonuclease V alpha subunit
MVIHNNYRLGVFNGDIGIIKDINSGGIVVDFDGCSVTFNDEDNHILTLAYATTVHKSQGSEFKLIIMVVMRSHYIMLQKNLFYTGITRAKEKLVLVCQESAVKRCLDNKDKKERYTLLRERLAASES